MIEKTRVLKRSEVATATALQIEQHYLQQIRTGHLPPGSRLPPNNELRLMWKTSNATVQRALSTLTADGLVERRKGRGTFVRGESCQTLIGLLVGPNLAANGVGFYRGLVMRIRELVETDSVAVRVYDGLTPLSIKQGGFRSLRAKAKPSGGKKGSYIRGLQSFLIDSRYNAFHSYIFLGTSNVHAEEVMDDLAPRVTFHDEVRGDDVILDSTAFLEESLTQLAARGAKRIAYIQASEKDGPTPADVLPAVTTRVIAKRAGVTEFFFWDLPLTKFNELGTNEFLQSGFLEEKIRRKLPDAIIISDDIVARPVIFNLVQRGFRIPRDVKICVRVNDAQELYYGEPVYRYELPVGEIARTLTNLLRLRIADRPEPPLPIRIRGRFLDL